MDCTKKQFATKDEAIKRLEQIKKEDQRKKTPRRVYPCSKCGYWHLTSMTSREQKAMAKRLKEIEQKREIMGIIEGERLAEFYAAQHGWDY